MVISHTSCVRCHPAQIFQNISSSIIRSKLPLSQPHVFHSHSFGQAFDLLVTVRCVCYHTYTPALSTSSSSRGLIGFLQGYLILRGASRLDAFSVYPFQTWLPCYAIGMTTGEPAVRPARSSRTKASSFQISYARAG